MPAPKVVKRGYVVLYKSHDGEHKLTAVVSRIDAASLRKKVGGTIHSAEGYAYRLAQGSLRVIVNKEGFIQQALKR